MIIASAFIAMFAGIGFSLGGLFFWENKFGQGRKCFRLQAEFMHEIFSKTVEFLYMMFFCGHMYIYIFIDSSKKCILLFLQKRIRICKYIQN